MLAVNKVTSISYYCPIGYTGGGSTPGNCTACDSVVNNCSACTTTADICAVCNDGLYLTDVSDCSGSDICGSGTIGICPSGYYCADGNNCTPCTTTSGA
jgi:hypothetical protein